MHYLIWMKRDVEEEYEKLKIIIIPLEIACITIAISALNAANIHWFIPVVVFALSMSGYLAVKIEKYKGTCHFWNDCIEVLFDDSHHVNP